jgi:hypothetical protein
MELVLLPVTAVTRLTVHPPDQGLTAELSAKTDSAKGMRQLLWFACGHCRLEEEDQETAEIIHKVFTFGGLKSHLYSKYVRTLSPREI